MSALLQGFMSDFQETVEAQVWKEEEHICLGLKEYWYDFMDEVANLRSELDSFVGENEVVQVRSTDPLQTSLGGKLQTEQMKSIHQKILVMESLKISCL
ncbi:WPP domain-associated protein [Prunus yedoensis var. nudiflora]|uniref:WPP domain-associated protein n=1 Tax=Prunus yedoensis var. nudiflora TaxID=2094558 RepID=A0A314UYY9_PRUYE|nr:WPP domain-associated protein [Prunus yedoensis var. nudiflora]